MDARDAGAQFGAGADRHIPPPAEAGSVRSAATVGRPRMSVAASRFSPGGSVTTTLSPSSVRRRAMAAPISPIAGTYSSSSLVHCPRINGGQGLAILAQAAQRPATLGAILTSGQFDFHARDVIGDLAALRLVLGIFIGKARLCRHLENRYLTVLQRQLKLLDAFQGRAEPAIAMTRQLMAQLARKCSSLSAPCGLHNLLAISTEHSDLAPPMAAGRLPWSAG